MTTISKLNVLCRDSRNSPLEVTTPFYGLNKCDLRLSYLIELSILVIQIILNLVYELRELQLQLISCTVTDGGKPLSQLEIIQIIQITILDTQ
jgi:hypothetical protein